MSIDRSRRDFLLQSTGAVALASLTARSSLAISSQSDGKKLKIGQIGVGHSHAKGKMEVLRQSPDWDVVGVVEPNPELRAEAQRNEIYRDLRWMAAEELLGTPGLQAVAVETTVDRLLEVAHQCIATGKHIHLDKPPGSSLTEFKRLLSESDRQGLVVQLGYMYRYNPAILLLHKLLDKGWLGEVFEIHAVMSKEVGASKRQRWSKYPGGTMYELGCHLIDLVVGVLGKPDEVESYNTHTGEFDDDLLDNMLAVCKYPRATATVKSTALEVEGFARRQFVVCGTKGTLHIQPLDDPTAQLALSEPRGEFSQGYQEVTFAPYKRYEADLAELASVIRGEKVVEYGSAHDLAAQETLLQACGLPC